MPDREELAWAAGFFDGEGHVRCSLVQEKQYPLLRVEVAQRDPQVLERFQRVIGCGRIYAINRKPPKNSYYNWHVGRFEHAQAVIALLWTWLSPVKRKQAKVALARVQEAYNSGRFPNRKNLRDAKTLDLPDAKAAEVDGESH